MQQSKRTARLVNYILLLSLIIVSSSCLTTKQTNLLREPGGSIPSYPPVESIGEYTVNPGDELNIVISLSQETAQIGTTMGASAANATASLFRLFTLRNGNIGGDGNKLRTLAVSPEGYIYFPYLGNLYVAGKTTLEIQTELEDRLKKDIIQDEECFVYVNLNNRYYSMIGETSVGRFAIPKEQMTVFQALAQSGDIRTYGNRAKVKILRQQGNQTVIKEFDLRSEDIVNSEFYYIQPNDVIYIEPLGRQFWGISSFGGFFAVLTTIASLGITVYNLTK